MDVPRRLADRRLLPGYADPAVLHAVRVPRPRQDRGDVPQALNVLDRRIVAAPTPEAARALLGARLVRDDDTGLRVARIVEVEAYGGPEDRASHARFASVRRNGVMAGPAGLAYVYLVYGMYDCLNVVTGAEGAPSAVLIRAVEPLDGIDAMRRSRLVVESRRRASRTPEGSAAAEARIAATRIERLATGPGLVAAAFGIDTTWTGRDVCDPASTLRLERDPDDPADAVDDDAVEVTPRIGIDYAGADWASRPWRFAIAGHPSVSGSRAR